MSSQITTTDEDPYPGESHDPVLLPPEICGAGGYIKVGDLLLAVMPQDGPLVPHITSGSTPLGGSANVGLNVLRHFLTSQDLDTASLLQAMCTILTFDQSELCPELTKDA